MTGSVSRHGARDVHATHDELAPPDPLRDLAVQRRDRVLDGLHELGSLRNVCRFGVDVDRQEAGGEPRHGRQREPRHGPCARELHLPCEPRRRERDLDEWVHLSPGDEAPHADDGRHLGALDEGHVRERERRPEAAPDEVDGAGALDLGLFEDVIDGRAEIVDREIAERHVLLRPSRALSLPAHVDGPDLEPTGRERLFERAPRRVEADHERVHPVPRHDEHGASLRPPLLRRHATKREPHPVARLEREGAARRHEPPRSSS